jgi:lysophospholipase L1-like esterase
VLVASLLGAGGCHVGDVDGDGTITVACVGDSNTLFWSEPRWCELLAERVPRLRTGLFRKLPTKFRNFAWGGMTVCPHPRDDSPWGMRQLEAARAAHADVVIAAFGTNDVRALHRSAEEIVDCYRRLVDAAAPVPVVVALTPPTQPPEPDANPAIDEVNQRLRAAFPAGRLLDFHDGFGPELFDADGIHLNAGGQARRAALAAAWLTR